MQAFGLRASGPHWQWARGCIHNLFQHGPLNMAACFIRISKNQREREREDESQSFYSAILEVASHQFAVFHSLEASHLVHPMLKRKG